MTKDELIEFMKTHNLSAEDVAQKCYVSPDAVYSWRTGRRVMNKRMDVLLKHNMENKNEVQD